MIDRILYNGIIHTLNNNQPCVSALAISRDRVVVCGDDDPILHLATADTIRHNLNGKTVIPGLTDAHIHWQWTSVAMQEVDVFEVPEKAIALERVAERVVITPPGQWVTGNGWTQDFWPDRAFPTAADLDSVAPEHPVCLQAKSGHAVWVNSAALRLCGISASMPDPEAGQIVRDSTGQPTGILLENAMNIVVAAIPEPSPEQVAEYMKVAQQRALASGLTGIHDFDGPDCFRALQILREQGQLSLRVLKNVQKGAFPSILESGVRWGFGDDWIRIGGLKLFADGALGPRTASMIAPYENEPGNYGIIVTDKEEMVELVGKASAAGLPSTIHAIGDRAVHDVLDVYETVRRQEAARGELPQIRRHRIEHVQIIHPDDVHRLAEMQIIASMQPIHATSDYQMADHYWGERSRWSYNPRLQIDEGAVVAFGSDSPVEPFDPLLGIYAAVTRRRPDGSPGTDGWYPGARLSLDEALRGFTIGPAFAAGMEDRLGKLAPGFLADLVVLDRDLYAVPADEIRIVKPLATMVGGDWKFGGI